MIDEQNHTSMLYMLENPIKDVFYENFTVDVEAYGETRVDELKPGGAKIQVTDGNKAEYIELRVQYYLQKQIEAQAEALRSGIY